MLIFLMSFKFGRISVLFLFMLFLWIIFNDEKAFSYARKISHYLDIFPLRLFCIVLRNLSKGQKSS